MYQYQVSFGEAIKRAFKNYYNFKGRASRSEYWWFMLFVNIVEIALYLFYFCVLFTSVTLPPQTDFYGGVGYDHTALLYSLYPAALMGLFVIAVILPSWGLLFRRLHDTGRSGWWCLISLIPFVGGIILLVFCCQESQPFENMYGPEPNMASYPGMIPPPVAY